MIFDHTTRRQLLRELREMYRVAEGQNAAKIAGWMASQSDEDIREAFGAQLTNGQVNSLRTKLSGHADKLAAVRGVKGE